MALRTISAAGGNFNATASWVEGIVPTTSDHVVGDASSGNLTINGVYTIQYADLSAYTGTLIFTGATPYSSVLAINAAATTTNFGASMSFSYTGPNSLCGAIRLNNNHTIIHNTTSRIPTLWTTGGSGTFTLSTNLYVNSIYFDNTSAKVFNNNTIFINEYCLNSTNPNGGLSQTSTTSITFDGPVRFSRLPYLPNNIYANSTFTINTNSTLFFEPSLGSNLTYNQSFIDARAYGLYVPQNFSLLQGTISMVNASIPYLQLLYFANSNWTINTGKYNIYRVLGNQVSDTGVIHTFSMSSIGTLILDQTYPAVPTSPTGSAVGSNGPLTLNSTRDINIDRIRFICDTTQPASNPGFLPSVYPIELRLAGTYSYSVGDIISIGGGDYFLPQTGGITFSTTFYPFNSTWVQYNMIRSSVAGTKAKLKLTGGTSSFIGYTNFRDIDASGGKTIKTFNPIQGSQVSNSDNIEVIYTTAGGGESSYTFVN